MTETESAILDYFRDQEEPLYLPTVLSEAGVDGLVRSLLALLRSEDTEHNASACLWLRDMLLMEQKHPVTRAVRAGLPTSELLAQLHHMVWNPITCANVVYTLGKICSEESLPVLEQAISFYQEQDPLNLLPVLLCETRWLSSRPRWDLLEGVLNSSFYLTRWAGLNRLMQYGRFQDEGPEADRYLAGLRQDEHAQVRAEAEYEYQALQLRKRIRELTKPEQKEQRRQLRAQEPAVRFLDLQCRFGHYARERQLTMTSRAVLEQFVEEEIARAETKAGSPAAS